MRCFGLLRMHSEESGEPQKETVGGVTKRYVYVLRVTERAAANTGWNVSEHISKVIDVGWVEHE